MANLRTSNNKNGVHDRTTRVEEKLSLYKIMWMMKMLDKTKIEGWVAEKVVWLKKEQKKNLWTPKEKYYLSKIYRIVKFHHIAASLKCPSLINCTYNNNKKKNIYLWNNVNLFPWTLVFLVPCGYKILILIL